MPPVMKNSRRSRRDSGRRCLQVNTSLARPSVPALHWIGPRNNGRSSKNPMPFVEYNSKRLLFIHVPKTGGSSIESWLGGVAKLRFKLASPAMSMRCTPQHLTCGDMLALFGEDYFHRIFSIVRNPYTRLESEYRWRTGGESKVTFEQWALRALTRFEKNAWISDNHFRPQVEFQSRNVTVFRFEDGLEPVCDWLRRELAISEAPPLPHEKRTENIQVDLTWTPELRARVETIYRDDFDTFGYARRELT
jgi:hypothetical protein